MTEEKHIIKKAIVEIYVPSANNAMEMQNKALSFFKEKICPIIEKIVEKYANSGETIRIDKLELDFENFNPEHTNENELRKLEQQIEEKLIKLISEEGDNNFSGEILATVKKIPKEKADEELFLHLLKTGTLPWWAKTEDSISLEALAQKIIQQPSESFKKEIKVALAIPAVRQRIAYKLSVASIEKLLSLLSDSPSTLLMYINDLLNFTKDNFLASENVRQLVYEYALTYSSSSHLSFRSFVSGFLKRKNDLLFSKKLYKTINTLDSNEIIIGIKKALADADEHFSNSIKKAFNIEDRKIFFDENDKKKIIFDVSGETNNVKETHDIEYTGDFFIKNSGIIILSPYLPMFFKELDLSDGKTFVSEEAKEKAVCLLQYLITGNAENLEEHEMVLNKILCGLDIATPILLQFIISEKEKQECQNLLQAVADNWPALKGTSGEGMRDAFFMRDGIFEQQSNGWNLKIEKTTIDILLDKLPWGISIIQMPWSSEMIFVEW